MTLSAEMAANLGPLAPLAGTWEGDQGIDIAMSHKGVSEETRFRERITFEPLGPVNNTRQVLYGLRYHTTAWPIGQEAAFHEELGYWLYDADAGLVMRAFMVPRGVLVNAGAEVAPDATRFTLKAREGATDLGVLSNPVIAKNATTELYEVTVTIHPDGRFHYHENTQLRFKGADSLFQHTDENTLSRVD